MNTETDPLYVRAVTATLVPFIIIFIFFAGMLIKNRFRSTYNSTHYVICVVVVNVFLQPTVLKELTAVITCEEFEKGQMVLKIKKEIDCKSEDHLYWVNNNIKPHFDLYIREIIFL